ncbi:MAG: hypothetical protein HY074_12090 [Deltaproteobacteria bacterium]|nr:hypothetical protein [Deltaproteobacteria bacterium]
MKIPHLVLPFFCFLVFSGFTFRVTEDLGSLDWGKGEVPPLVIEQLMEGLTTSGENGAPVPALASGWKAGRGAKHFIFFLRAGAKWSDGKPVCAQQFVDAWRRVQSPEFASPYAHYLSDLQSAHAVGCDRLEVRLKHSAAYFPALASHWVLAPIRLDLLKKFGRNWLRPENLAVTGPYVLDSWVAEKEFILKRNPSYYGPSPNEERLKAVVVSDDATALNLFQSGALDWLRDVPFLEKERLAKTKEYSVYPAFVGYHLGFLMNGEAALDRNARCALAQALDKRNIPLILKGGETAAGGILPPGLGGDAEAGKFDAARARQLWSSSRASKPGIPLELNYYAKDIHGVLVQWLQQEWKKNLGIDVRLIRTEPKTYWAQLLFHGGIYFR